MLFFFKIDRVVAFVRVAQENFLIATAPLSYLMVSLKIMFFTQISSCIKASIKKKWRANIYNLLSCTC